MENLSRKLEKKNFVRTLSNELCFENYELDTKEFIVIPVDRTDVNV